MFPWADSVARRYPPIVVWSVIGISALAFLYQVGLPPRVLDRFLFDFALVPSRFFGQLSLVAPSDWTPFLTDIFLHVADGEPLRPLTTAEFRVDKNRVVFSKDLIGMVESNDPNAKVGNLTISIRYKHYPVYHIIDVDRELMQVREGKPCATRREALTAMPVKVVGRKAEYVFPPMRYGDVPYDNTVK